MRGFLVLCAAILGAIGIGIAVLGASGSDRVGPALTRTVGLSSPTKIADIFVHSLAEFPSESITMTFPHLGTSAPRLLSGSSIVLDESTNSTAALGTSKSGTDLDISALYRSQMLFDLRVIAPERVYALVDITNILNLPVHESPALQRVLQLLAPELSGRWFKLPIAQLGGLSKAGDLPPSATTKLGKQIVSGLRQAVGTGRLSQSGSTQVVTFSGTNASVLRPLVRALPAIGKLARIPGVRLSLPSFRGDFAVSLRGDTSGLLHAVTFKDSAGGGFDIDAVITEPSLSISAPANASPLPPSILKGLKLGLPTD